MDNPLIIHVIKLTVGLFAAVSAVMVWARRREGAWMLVVLAVFVGYTRFILRFLLDAGLFVRLDPLIFALGDALVLLLLGVALIVRTRERDI